ncbi:MAG: amino acid adenylation domain-containing protein, partial [Ferruginibacter sp.]
YSTDLYKEDTIRRMGAHFDALLNSVLKDPHQKIGLLPMLRLAESQQILEEFNDSKVAYPADKSVPELFEEQVLKTPYKTALVFEDEKFTYRQLNERANQLAHYLKSKGVLAGSLIPLYLERSASMIIGIMGIMKAGAAYVPIDTDLPEDRVSFMLSDTGSKIVVTSRQSSTNLPATDSLILITIDGEELNDEPTVNLTTKVEAASLAYLIYTSGSTGKPKGVMIEHRSLADYTFGLIKQIRINECHSFALVSTIATDLGNTVIYASLLSGGSLHVFSKESVTNIEYLHDYFSEYGIDCLKIVPSHWKALRNVDEFLLPKKLLVFGGEALQTDLVEEILSSGTPCRVVNHYGPTETTIGKLLHEVKHGISYNKTIPIGKPFSNTKSYVLSKQMQLCPVGIPGQLFLSGDGVARGYFNNEVLTKEKFIADTFSKEPGLKMYGTGDLVKWLEDGNIEFIGRVDDQVKIRGYRIELGEIETVLQQSSLVSQAVVLAREDKQGNKRLVAFIVPQEQFDRDGIIAYLKDLLPEYMIPLVFMELDALPLTANGKINRKSLPDPDAAELLSGQFTAPRNEAEEKLAAIWQDILEVDQVGIHDDFFELGGHSLLAVRLISAIRKAFVVEMPIGDIFDHPTVALLAARIASESDPVVLAD